MGRQRGGMGGSGYGGNGVFCRGRPAHAKAKNGKKHCPPRSLVTSRREPISAKFRSRNSIAT